MQALWSMTLEHEMSLNKSCLILLLLCFSCCLAALPAQSLQTPQSAGTAQGSVPTDFPVSLLQGEEDFNLAIDVYADSRGNFGPCG